MTNLEKLKEKIAKNELVKGIFIIMPDAISSEIAGYCGYDFVWIDAEHGALDRQEIYRHVIAAQGAGCCAFVRIRAVEPSIVKSVLDMGPDGIIFPFCNTAEIARTAVKACSYPDDRFHGVRGQGPIRAIRYGLDDEGEYMKAAYDKVWKICQIETMEGYQNVDAILDVEGIDSLFIGSADLSRSIQGLNDPTITLDSVFADLVEKIGKSDKVLGAYVNANREEATAAKKMGIQWVVNGQDSRTLAMGMKANLEAISI
jgi:2-dehydro-3-deoxyglucarate aldolase/4-hydroxy-2-oxoheptanedioate aldolase